MPDKPPFVPREQRRQMVFLWLLVGLLPIPFLLAFTSSKASSNIGPVVFCGCIVCNLIGGLGCVSSIKNVVARILVGLLVAFFLFVLSLIVGLAPACIRV